jgi:DNA-binding CsgD family transcriptional regulator
MTLTESEVLRLAASSYDAATAPELWPVFLKSYVEAFSADSAVLQIHDFRQRKSTILVGFGINSRLKSTYNDYYAKLNLWRNHGFARGRYVAGRTVLSEDLCPRSLLEGSEFYNDFLLQLDGVDSMGSVIAMRNGCAPTLTVLRGRRKSIFGETERRVADFLLPHLARAWTIHQRLDVLAAGERVLDSLPYGVVFLAADCSLVYCNHSAEQILRKGDGLSLRGGMLCASDRTAEVRLRNLIARAVSADSPAAAVPVLRRSCSRPYQVVAAPIRSRFRQFTGMAAPSVVVLIVDPELTPATHLDFLIQLYGLTVKEAQVACSLSQGKTVEQTAEELQISYETARTHLRRIFSKTQTSRQSELLLLLARLPLAKEN